MATGFSLMELLLALSLSAVLALGMIQIASGTQASFRLQDSLAGLQEHAQIAADLLTATISSAAFQESPWISASPMVLLPESSDGAERGSDRLVVLTRSDRNCFGFANEDLDGAGYPRFYFKKTAIGLRRGDTLILSCSYGAALDALVRQIRNQGLIENVESLQFLFGEDMNMNSRPDRWVKAGQWSNEASVVAVRTGLLLSSDQFSGAAEARSFSILDQHLATPPDRKIRHAIEVTHALRGRLN